MTDYYIGVGTYVSADFITIFIQFSLTQGQMGVAKSFKWERLFENQHS